MKNLVNLLIKTILSLLVLYLLIPVFGKSTWTQTIVTGLILVALSYVVGDMWILPKRGNFVAAIADFGLSALIIWLMMKALPHFTLSSSGIWVIAFTLAVVEWFFHLYLLKTQAPGKKVHPT